MLCLLEIHFVARMLVLLWMMNHFPDATAPELLAAQLNHTSRDCGDQWCNSSK